MLEGGSRGRIYLTLCTRSTVTSSGKRRWNRARPACDTPATIPLGFRPAPRRLPPHPPVRASDSCSGRARTGCKENRRAQITDGWHVSTPTDRGSVPPYERASHWRGCCVLESKSRLEHPRSELLSLGESKSPVAPVRRPLLSLGESNAGLMVSRSELLSKIESRSGLTPSTRNLLSPRRPGGTSASHRSRPHSSAAARGLGQRHRRGARGARSPP